MSLRRPTPAVEVEPLDRDGIAAATGLILVAFAGRENARLGARYLASWLCSFGGESSLLLARRAGAAVGLVVGTPEACEAARYRRLRRTAVVAVARRPWCLLDPAMVRMAIRRVRPEPVPGGAPAAWYLALLATHPAARDEGVGAALLGRFEDEGRRRGWQGAALHVRQDQSGARRFYERCGWSPVAPAWPGRWRYEKDLGAVRVLRLLLLLVLFLAV